MQLLDNLIIRRIPLMGSRQIFEKSSCFYINTYIMLWLPNHELILMHFESIFQVYWAIKEFLGRSSELYRNFKNYIKLCRGLISYLTPTPGLRKCEEIINPYEISKKLRASRNFPIKNWIFFSSISHHFPVLLSYGRGSFISYTVTTDVLDI